MFSEKDFERLWVLYKTEGEPKGVSINSFCISNNIPYTAFYDWFKKTQKKVVPVEVEGIPEELIHGLCELHSVSNSVRTFDSGDYSLHTGKLKERIDSFLVIDNVVLNSADLLKECVLGA